MTEKNGKMIAFKSFFFSTKKKKKKRQLEEISVSSIFPNEVKCQTARKYSIIKEWLDLNFYNFIIKLKWKINGNFIDAIRKAY